MLAPADTARINQFLAKVREIGDDEQRVRMVALAELSWIHGRKNPSTGETYHATTNRSLITEYRNAIRAELKLSDESPLMKAMRYSKARVTEYREHQQEQRHERHHNQRPLNAQEHIERGVALLTYSLRVRWSNAAAIASVVALTGRRPWEVACVGGFEVDADDPAGHRVMFTGQTKTREQERAAAAYSIPVLAERALVLEAVERLREAVDPALDNKVYSQRFGKEVGVVAKRSFHDVNGTEILPRELREAYAAAANHKFAPPEITEVQFYNEVLGHQGTDLNTSLFYFAFFVIDGMKIHPPVDRG